VESRYVVDCSVKSDFQAGLRRGGVARAAKPDHSILADKLAECGFVRHRVRSPDGAATACRKGRREAELTPCRHMAASNKNGLRIVSGARSINSQ